MFRSLSLSKETPHGSTIDTVPSDGSTPGEITWTTLTVTKEGNGTINSTPTGLICGSHDEICTHSFESDQTVMLTAIPDAGWQLTSWQGDCGKTGNVTMVTSPVCQANFIQVPVPVVLANSWCMWAIAQLEMMP